MLSGLRVERPHDTAPAYSRDAWEHWVDDDGDGCDTRREVLIAEAVVAPQVGAGCRLVGGQWLSPYDGAHTTDASSFDIDHLVPLAEAHRSGGWAWDAATKRAFANDLSDPRPLVAVSASSNRSKSDKDPAGWLPARDECRYIADWIAVKAHWQLSVDAEEATVLSDLLLGRCAGTTIAPWGSAQPAPISLGEWANPAPAPSTTAATPSPPDSGTCHPNYDPCLPIVDDLDCADVRRLGVERPVRIIGADPYRLDGSDKDGLGCEG